jgi:hypothetical protein
MQQKSVFTRQKKPFPFGNRHPTGRRATGNLHKSRLGFK